MVIAESPVKISYLQPSQEKAWDDFVVGHPDGSPFHLTAWRNAIRSTFGHEPLYLVAEQGGEILGVLPLFNVRTLLFGAMLVSVPFAVYGGALATGQGVATALETEAVRLARELRVDYLEFRDQTPNRSGPGTTRDLYVTFRKELPSEEGEVLDAIPRKTRRMVRLGIEAGLSGRVTSEKKDVDAFYRLFAANLRKLGTPAFPKSLVRNLLTCFGRSADILLVESGGVPVAGVLNLYFRDQVLPYYSGTVERFNSVGAPNFLYYDLMVKSIARGARLFDFGRSKIETGPFHFKRHFGFEPVGLPYRQVLIRAKEPKNLNPTNPKYRKAIELWKKLPLSVTTALGPWIIRGIP